MRSLDYLLYNTVCWSEAQNSYTDDGTDQEVGQGKKPQEIEASTMVSKEDCKRDG